MLEGVRAVELRPRPTVSGWYDRRVLERVRLIVDGGQLVAVDTNGRRHPFPLDGSPGAPATICTRVHTGAVRNGIRLAVLDRDNRILVSDDTDRIWSDAEVARFARRTGLHWPEGGVAASTNHPAKPVHLDTVGRRAASLFGVPMVGGGVIGIGFAMAWPLVVMGAIAVVCGVTVWLLYRGGAVRITSVPDGPW